VRIHIIPTIIENLKDRVATPYNQI